MGCNFFPRCFADLKLALKWYLGLALSISEILKDFRFDVGVAIFTTKKISDFSNFFFLENYALVFACFLDHHVGDDVDPYTKKKNVFYVIFEQLLFLSHVKKVKNRKVRGADMLVLSADFWLKKNPFFFQKIPFFPAF